MTQKQKQARKEARRLPAYMQHVAFTKAGKAKRITGTFGAASEVRSIDPADYALTQLDKGRDQ